MSCVTLVRFWIFAFQISSCSAIPSIALSRPLRIVSLVGLVHEDGSASFVMAPSISGCLELSVDCKYHVKRYLEIVYLLIEIFASHNFFLS